MYFNIEAFAGDYAMHCKTEKEAIDFCTYLDRNDRCWRTAALYINNTMWNILKENTVYYFNEGIFGDVETAKRGNYTILEWSDYMNKNPSIFTKEDLKTGDVLLRRDGAVEIYNGELDMLILQEDWDDPSHIRLDLTSERTSDADIMAIRRPIAKSSCIFGAFEEGHERGILVYQREEVKEVEEMTLKEVCKLLGKEIKIIPG